MAVVSYIVLFAVLLSVLICSLVSAQGYTETFNWPGPPVIPDDGREFITTGAILVQLPSNTTSEVTREVRIRSQVNLTMDCGPHIDFEKSRIPANLPTTQRTIWYHVEKDLDGNFLATNTTVVDSSETDIFGPDMRFLRIAMPTVTVPAKQGNAGLYTCRFCYAVSIGQFINNEFCEDQATHSNVIGISPMIDRTVAAPGGIVIGTTICLDGISDEITITCSQNSTNQPELEPRATFLIDGQQQPDVTLENPVIELPGIGDTVLILLQTYITLGNPEPRTVTCFLNNTFGSDMETSLILRNPTVTSFTGSIQNSISNGCNGTRPSNVICPSEGQTVNLNCTTNSIYNTINITSPNGTVYINTSPIFIAESELFGTYTCTASSDCGQQTQTFILEECKLPEVTVSGSISNISGDGCSPASNGQKICAYIGQNVTISCVTNDTDYTIQGPQGIMSLNQPLTFTVGNNNYGTYYCNSSNVCGQRIDSIELEEATCDLPVFTLFRARVMDNQPVTNFCFAGSTNGSIIDCETTNGVTRRWFIDGELQFVRGEIRGSPDISVSRAGLYTCTLTNSCGTVNNSILITASPPNIATGSSVITDTSITAIPGDTACINSSDPSSMFQLTCTLTNVNQSLVSNITWFNNQNSLIDTVLTSVSVDSITITATSSGNYFCSAINDCGNDTGSVTVESLLSIITGSGNDNRGTVSVGGDGCIGNNGLIIMCNIIGDIPATRRWYRDGMILSGESGSNFFVSPGNDGSYRCEVSNKCDNISSETIARSNPTAAISGSIFGISGDGCTPPSSGAKICALAGQSVTISCTTTSGTDYVIAGPNNRMIQNQPLTFTIGNNDYGIYNCSSSNVCGSNTSTIELENADCPLPIIMANLRQNNGSSAPACYRSDNDLYMDCNEGSGPPASNISWYINGVLQSNNTNTQQITQAGNYTCVRVNECGSNSATRIIKISPALPPSSSIITNPGSNSVSIGTDTCISAGSSVTLSCQLTVSSSLVEPFTRVWTRDGTGSSVTITATSGTYKCTVSNECGMAMGQSNVISRVDIMEGSGISTANTVDIGTRVCLVNDMVTIRCNLNSGSGNVMRRWYENGVLISGQTGSTYTVSPAVVGRNYRCEVSNECNTDSATTVIDMRPTISLTAMISVLNISDNGCGRPRTPDNADYCPFDGENITISCTTTASYTILGPRGQMSIDSPIMIDQFDSTMHSGTYTCVNTPASLCGSTPVSITVFGAGVPPVIPPGIGDIPPIDPTKPVLNTTINNDVCIYDNQTVSISCESQQASLPINYTWTIPPSTDVISTGQLLTGVSFGTYQCKAINRFGESNGVTNVYRALITEFTASSPQKNRCTRLMTAPPGYDFCSFVGDTLTLNCTANDPNATVNISPGDNMSPLIFNPVPVINETYTCNVTSECGSVIKTISVAVFDPAKIDRTIPLPRPLANEVIDGAGRPDDPLKIQQNKTVILHCPYSGIDPADTDWFLVRPDRVAILINASANPAYRVTDNGSNVILTISPFTKDLAGIYRCSTTNNAGNDTGDVVLQFDRPVFPEWFTETWSKCDPPCHRGMRMRMVWCRDRDSHMRLPDNRCRNNIANSTKPLTMESCKNAGPCFTTPTWKHGDWSECSHECGGGTRYRSAQCIIPATGIKVPESRCEQHEKPITYENCNTHPCCKEDAYSGCKWIAGTHTCSFSYVKDTLCCWSCRYY